MWSNNYCFFYVQKMLCMLQLYTCEAYSVEMYAFSSKIIYIFGALGKPVDVTAVGNVFR